MGQAKRVSDHGQRRKLRGLILAMSMPISLAAIQSHAAVPATVPYGVIEIGAKGVKTYLFDIDRAAKDPACAAEGDAYLKCVDPKTLSQTNCDPIKDPGFKCTAPAVGTYWNDFKTKYSLPADHIYVVGSSSLSDQLRRDLLIGQVQNEVKELVNRPIPIEFVKVDEESTYTLQGVLGMLPDRVRAMRAAQAAIIDIGSGNIKGAYQSMDGGHARVVIFGVSYGTRVATDAILESQKDQSLRTAADTWRTTVLIPKLSAEIENKDGISNRNRVYLTGGIVWALAVLSHPDDATKFSHIDPHTIDDMLARSLAPDASAKLCGDERKAKYPEIGKVCDTFSANQLVGGFEILKGLSEKLDFAGAQKHLFFFRDALYAWPLGYIRNKLAEQSAKTAATSINPAARKT